MAGNLERGGVALCPQARDVVFGQSGRQDCHRRGQAGYHCRKDEGDVSARVDFRDAAGGDAGPQGKNKLRVFRDGIQILKMLGGLVEETAGKGIEPKQESFWWTGTYAQETEAPKVFEGAGKIGVIPFREKVRSVVYR